MSMNWDDLRYFLAIARAESLSGAGRELGVSQPTVSRRLAAIEDRLGVRLFDRTKQGYMLSPAGSGILETVEHVEQELADIDRRVFGEDWRLRGSLRVTCTAVMAKLYLAEPMARFVTEHPDIDLSVMCTFQHLSLSRREADVAIRVTDRPPDTLVGRRLCDVALGVYASAERARSIAGGDAAPGAWDWIGWQDETYNRLMISAAYPKARIRHRVDDMLTMRAMVAAGLGVVALPCYVADRDQRLRRVVAETMTQAGLHLWVLSHPDVRRVARVRLFSQFIAEAIVADHDLFEGGRPWGHCDAVQWVES